MLNPNRCPAEKSVYDAKSRFKENFLEEYWGDLDHLSPSSYVFRWDDDYQCVLITTKLYFEKHGCFLDGHGFFPENFLTQFIGGEVMESAFECEEKNLIELEKLGMKRVLWSDNES